MPAQQIISHISIDNSYALIIFLESAKYAMMKKMYFVMNLLIIWDLYFLINEAVSGENNIAKSIVNMNLKGYKKKDKMKGKSPQRCVVFLTL